MTTTTEHVYLPDDAQATAGRTVAPFTTAELPTAAAALLAQRAGWLRSRADAVGHDVAAVHQEIRNYDLEQRAAVKSRHAVSALLTELAVDRGMAWADIARSIGVTVAAVRKWRTGSSATADNRLALARLAAFLDLLGEYAIDDPAQWMEMRLPLPSGYVITPIDLYQRQQLAPLLEYASQRCGPAQLLDEIDPHWRDSRSDFETYVASDGMKAIRVREVGA